MAIIYKIENRENHKVYIGQTKCTLEWRLNNSWCGHLTRAFKHKDKSYLYESLRKYGKESFTYEIIEERSNDSFKDRQSLTDWLNEREKYWIAKYHSNEDAFGYNKTDGGQTGFTYKHSEEYKKSLSLRIKQVYATGEPQKKISKSVKEAHRNNPEILEKIRNKSKNSIWVYKINEQGVEEKHFIWTHQLDEFLSNGYTKGLPPSLKETFCYSQLGKSRTNEEKAKISKTLTGKKKSKEHARHISEGQKGKVLSEELKKKISEKTKLAMSRPEVREKMIKSLRGRRWINNGTINKCVKEEQLEEFLSQNWSIGRK